MDIPAPGRGVQKGLQGFPKDGVQQSFFLEQNVDIPVPGGGLHDLPDRGA